MNTRKLIDYLKDLLDQYPVYDSSREPESDYARGFSNGERYVIRGLRKILDEQEEK